MARAGSPVNGSGAEARVGNPGRRPLESRAIPGGSLGGGARAPALRRDRDRRRPQRPGERRLSRAGGVEDGGARAPARARGRRCYRGALPGLPLFRLLVRCFPAPSRDHPRARPAPPRPRHPAPRWHVHAGTRGHGPAGAEGRQRQRDRHGRLPVAGQRPRSDGPRAAPLVEDGRRGVRGIRAAHGRHGPVHQADPGHRPARPGLDRPSSAPAAGRPPPEPSRS